RELDLGMVAVMQSERPSLDRERVAKKCEDRVATHESIAPRAVADRRVRGEAGAELVPALQVQAAKVAVLELPDGLDVLQHLHSRLELFQRRHAALLPGAGCRRPEARMSTRRAHAPSPDPAGTVWWFPPRPARARARRRRSDQSDLLLKSSVVL